MRIRDIVIAGPWAWAWGLWHIVWLLLALGGGIGVGLGFVEPNDLRLAFALLYGPWFLTQEIIGARRGDDQEDERRATTLSEFRQFLATQAKPDAPKFGGWKVFAGATGLIDASIVYWMLAPWSVMVAATLAVVIALWLVPHFGWKDIFG